MNQSTQQHSGEARLADPRELPGHRLREQRQANRLDIDTVASQLHLRSDIVEAIEQDDYAKLPNPVFTVGYMRNYARLLELDPEPLVESYRASLSEHESDELSETQHRSGGMTRLISTRLLTRLISLALFAALVAMLILWWQNRSPGLLPDQAQSSQASEPAPDAPDIETEPPQIPERLPVLQPAPASSQAPAPLPTAPVETTAPSVVPPPAPEIEQPQPQTVPDATTIIASAAPRAEEPVSAIPDDAQSAPVHEAPASEPQLVLSFSGNCWVEVRDGTRRILFTGEFGAGERRIIDGEPPYRFIIGNTALATLSIDGEPYDLGAHARGNVARFTLDPADLD